MAEIVVDILDGAGQKTGEEGTLTHVHRQLLWHHEVRLAILDREGNLLQRRANGRDPWDPFIMCQHVPAAETPEFALLRGLQALRLERSFAALKREGLTEVTAFPIRSDVESTLNGGFKLHSVFGHNYVVRFEDVTVASLQQRHPALGEVRAYTLQDLSLDMVNRGVSAYRQHVHRPDLMKHPHDGDLYGPLLIAAAHLIPSAST